MSGAPTGAPTGAAALAEARARLAAAGIEEAGRDARWLLAHVLGVDPGRVALVADAALSHEAEAQGAAQHAAA